MAEPPLAPWDQRAYDAALERGGELYKYITLFDDLCADREFCAAQGYAPEDSLGRSVSNRWGGPGIESHVRSGRCWDVYEARNQWRGVDLAHAPSDLSAWWRCCCKVPTLDTYVCGAIGRSPIRPDFFGPLTRKNVLGRRVGDLGPRPRNRRVGSSSHHR